MLFLFPSTFDTNGLVVREAAACGLGSVLVRGSCAAEDVTDGANGFLIDENADSMASCLCSLCRDPQIMKQVGEGALRDIYISWDTAVKAAVERYGLVIENYRSGLYPRHETPRDELLRGIGDLMNVIGTGEARRQELRNYLGDVLDGRRAGNEWFQPFGSDVTDAVFRNMKTGFEDWKSEVAHRREVLRARRSSLEESLEELYDIYL